MPIPESTSQKIKEKMAKRQIRHVKRPDCTNMQKFAEDCLKGIVLEDDSLVINISGCKQYDKVPRTEIRIEVLE